MKTYQPKKSEVKRDWHIVDAKGEILGRLATGIAKLLMGKHKATYSQHMDSGDYVVVVNAAKVEVTGKKSEQKVYRGHSGYPGGLKEVSYQKLITTFPERVIQKAVFGMLPGNRLRSDRLKRLKVYAGEAHPYKNKFTN